MAYDGTQFKPSWDCRDPRGGQGVSIMPPYIMSLQITEADPHRHTRAAAPPPSITHSPNRWLIAH